MHRRKIFVASAAIPLVAISAAPANAVTASGNRYCNPTNGYGWVEADHKGSAEQRPPGGTNHFYAYTDNFKYRKTFASAPGGGSWRAYGSLGLQNVGTGCMGG